MKLARVVFHIVFSGVIGLLYVPLIDFVGFENVFSKEIIRNYGDYIMSIPLIVLLMIYCLFIRAKMKNRVFLFIGMLMTAIFCGFVYVILTVDLRLD
ncbi:hypothetical protein D3C84_1113920 [compost metagenome]